MQRKPTAPRVRQLADLKAWRAWHFIGDSGEPYPLRGLPHLHGTATAVQATTHALERAMGRKSA